MACIIAMLSFCSILIETLVDVTINLSSKKSGSIDSKRKEKNFRKTLDTVVSHLVCFPCGQYWCVNGVMGV